MSFRFQKRVRVAPGVRINFSKRGISASAGPRGASVTVGRRGIHGNAGIPGTGLSYRTRLDKPTGRSRKSTTSTISSVQPSAPHEDAIQVDWNDDVQDFTFRTKDGRPLNDNEEKQVRRAYKTDLKRMYEDKAKEINEQTERLLEMHHQLFQPEADLIEIANDSIQEIDPPPSKDSLLKEVTKQQKKNLNFFQQLTIFLPPYKKEFNKKVLKETEKKLEALQRNYQEEKKELDDELAHRKGLATMAASGNTEAMEEWVSLFLDELDFPLETDVDFQVYSSEKVYVDIDLPTIDEVPIKKASILKTGRLKIADKTQRQHREEYALLVGGTAFYLASFFFRYLPTVKVVYVSGYNQILDNSTGHDVDQYIYSLEIDKNKLYSLNMKNVHPIKAFEHFEPRVNTTKTFIFKEIKPYSPDFN
ncbi:hypothetical protein J2S74_003607 [Evansella vedderi]|uniref:DUF4236 domain-containing protein n=1 Tax=Evansella vedderi TaxID=38282 RepID=A0ABT9ZY75_9BACI|nr:DUF4236 domain-containing protein [Evansella vedderi]MDQ0256189.1 hypothetical protein [Evansella vedderi]